MKHGLAAAALLGLVACAPVVTHGPRVAPGLSVGLTSGVAPATVCDSCAGMFPAMGVVGRWGFIARDPGVPSVQVGVGLKLGDVEGDVYVQAPSDGAAAYGAGVMATGYFVMPYVQWGLDRPDGTGFYTTQGFAVGTHSIDGLEHDELSRGRILPPPCPLGCRSRLLAGVVHHVVQGPARVVADVVDRGSVPDASNDVLELPTAGVMEQHIIRDDRLYLVPKGHVREVVQTQSIIGATTKAEARICPITEYGGDLA